MRTGLQSKVKIDAEFRSLIPPLRPEEREQLEANIIAEGCRDPLVIWGGKGILLDGHNRYEICLTHDIDFETVEIDLADREAAADWIDANQLGRRNLNPSQYSLLRGRRYNRLKRSHGGTGANQFKQTPQNEVSALTAERLAAQHGVSDATIERDGQFAAAVEKVKAVDPAIEAKVVSGKAPAKGLIVEAAKQIAKAEKVAKAEAETPLLGSKKDREAGAIMEKAKDKAEAILKGGKGTIAQVKRDVARAEKRADLEAKAEAVASKPDTDQPSWEIIEGDCLEVLPTIARGSVRLVFADPPYNIGIDYGTHYDDERDPDDFMEWCESWMRACVDVLTPDGSMWVLINDEWADVFGCLLRDVGLHRRSWIKWYESFGVNTSNNFNRCSRHLFYMVRNKDRFVFNADAVSRPSDRQAKYGDKRADPGGKVWDNVWGLNPAIPRLVGNAKERLPDLPTQLPLDLLRAVVGCASEPGDLVVDPFSGSGTTLAAAVELGRRAIGIEESGTFAGLARLRLTAAKGP